VLRIEALVYPRPWSQSLFLSELALRGSRAYFVARIGRDVVGYTGLMLSGEDGHITTIAVDPAHHRRKVGTRLLLVLAREALARHARNLTLEVRLSNQRGPGSLPALRVCGRSGCARTTTKRPTRTPLVMWAHDIDTPTTRPCSPRSSAPFPARPSTKTADGDPRRSAGHDLGPRDLL